MKDKHVTLLFSIIGLSIVWFVTHNWIAMVGAIISSIDVRARVER